MKLNKFIFPAPKPTYDMRRSNLYLIPSDPPNSEDTIPVIFIRNQEAIKNRLLIYFHGNGEDIHLASNMINCVCQQLGYHGVLVEYPSYGVYQHAQPSEEKLFSDAERVYDFFIRLKFRAQNVVLFGRSIGSGPAVYLASFKKVRALVLFSPYVNLQQIARDHLSILGFILKKQFRNDEYIRHVEDPVFIVHGKRDRLIPWRHSERLFAKVKHKVKVLRLPQ